MDIEVVLLVTLLSADLAFEGVLLVVAAHVQRVHHLVAERDVTMGTFVRAPCRRQVAVLVGAVHAVALRLYGDGLGVPRRPVLAHAIRRIDGAEDSTLLLVRRRVG